MAVTWTLAHARTADDKDLLSGVLILKDPENGVQSVPLFTNEELAERFIEGVPIPGIIAVRLESAESLREWLPEMLESGVEYVSANPVTDPRRRNARQPIPDFLDSLG